MKAKYEKKVSTPEGVNVWSHKYRSVSNIPHWHVEHELIYQNEGSLDMMVNNNFYTLSAGSCAFIKSEEIHYLRSDDTSVTSVIKIDPMLVKNIVSKKDLASPILGNYYSFQQAFHEILKETREMQEYYSVITDSIVVKLIAEIFRNEKNVATSVESETSIKKYKELLEYISENYSSVTFSDAADFMYFSKPYFSKYFLKLSGMTFTQYLNTLKVSAAVTKIKEGDLNMTEIAGMCGFSTIRNFNRVFKSNTGYSPKELPANYTYIHHFKDNNNDGFDPTLSCSKILE